MSRYYIYKRDLVFPDSIRCLLFKREVNDRLFKLHPDGRWRPHCDFSYLHEYITEIDEQEAEDMLFLDKL
ncbi:MAG: hypothetical protein GY861_29315 [bacterium]|nr:hypothetical protein [bacterium]